MYPLPGGMRGVVLHLKGMSFAQNLGRTRRAGYCGGTNSSEMPRAAYLIHYPARIDGPIV